MPASPAATSLACRHYASREPVTVEIDGERARVVAHGAGDGREPHYLYAPAFVELQINGYAGVNFSGAADLDEDDVATVVRTLWGHGVGCFLPTVTTGGFEDLRSCFTVLAASRRDPAVAASIPGFHLEGPYIAAEDGPRGAHRLEHVRPPSWDEFSALQDAADGKILLVTLAPELPGALPFIARLREAGVIAAIGHTMAGSAEIEAAVAAGAVLSTHLGNGAHATLPRHPNYLWDQLAHDELWASLIVDGHHLPPNVVKVMTRAKGTSRTILVTDAVTVAGLPPGRYEVEGKTVDLSDDKVVRLSGTPYLAGAAVTMPEAVHNVANFAGVAADGAIAMASLNPAALLAACTGVTLDPFGPETFTVLRWDAEFLEVVATVVGGTLRYRAPS